MRVDDIHNELEGNFISLFPKRKNVRLFEQSIESVMKVAVSFWRILKALFQLIDLVIIRLSLISFTPLSTLTYQMVSEHEFWIKLKDKLKDSL